MLAYLGASELLPKTVTYVLRTFCYLCPRTVPWSYRSLTVAALIADDRFEQSRDRQGALGHIGRAAHRLCTDGYGLSSSRAGKVIRVS